jgi:hypothetical protein
MSDVVCIGCWRAIYPVLAQHFCNAKCQGRGEQAIKKYRQSIYRQLFLLLGSRYNEHYGAEQIKGFQSLVRSIAVVTIVLIILNCAEGAPSERAAVFDCNQIKRHLLYVQWDGFAKSSNVRCPCAHNTPSKLGAGGLWALVLHWL